MKVTSKLKLHNILCHMPDNCLYVVRLDVTRKTSASYQQVNLSPNRDVLHVLGSSIWIKRLYQLQINHFLDKP